VPYPPSGGPTRKGFYEAIRSDDLAKLRTLVRQAGVDAVDAQGHTLLMIASAFGSADAIRMLIATGADVSRRESVHGRVGHIVSVTERHI
jgi:ankyrin repeat protein